jgi:hypothetical protein
MESWVVDQIFKWDHPRTIPAKLIWLSGFTGIDLNVTLYQNMHNLHNQYKSTETKVSQKTLNIC